MAEQKVDAEGHRKRDSGCLSVEGVQNYSLAGRGCYEKGSFRKIRRATETIESSKGRPLYEIPEQNGLGQIPGSYQLHPGYPSFHRKGSRRSSAFTPKATWSGEEVTQLSNDLGPNIKLTSIPSSGDLLPRINSFKDFSFGTDSAPFSTFSSIKTDIFNFSDKLSSAVPFVKLESSPEIGEVFIRKGAWTAEEDNLLINYCGVEAVKNWTDIAANIPGRTAKQCRERWCFNLDPSINKELWSPQEDLLLVKKQGEVGNKWAQIATLLPGRTENAVKTRFKSIIRAQKREWKPSEDQLLLHLYQQIGANWELIAKGMEAHRTKHAVKMRFKEIQAGLIHVKLPEYGSAKQTVRETYYPQSTLDRVSKYYQGLTNEGTGSGQLGKVLKRIPNVQNTLGNSRVDLPFHKSNENSFDQTLEDFLKIMSSEDEPLILA